LLRSWVKRTFAKRQIGVERKTERVFQPSGFIGEADGIAIVCKRSNPDPLR